MLPVGAGVVDLAVVGVFGQPDQIRHGQPRAGAGHRDPGTRFQFGKGGGDHDGDREAVVPAEASGGQRVAQDGFEGVVLTLRRAAVVAVLDSRAPCKASSSAASNAEK